MIRRFAVLLMLVGLTAAGCGSGEQLKAPTTRLDPTKRWTLTFTTDRGTFVVTLAPRVSPHATASLVALAQRGFYDGTIFHRIVPGFVIQGGDPTQTGGAGLGYVTIDRPPPSTHYAKGVVAMAKSDLEPPGTAGSQFFIMTADAPSLAPDYAVVGKVTRGMRVVDTIGTFGDRNDPRGTPTKIVVVRKVTAASR